MLTFLTLNYTYLQLRLNAIHLCTQKVDNIFTMLQHEGFTLLHASDVLKLSKERLKVNRVEVIVGQLATVKVHLG